MRKTIKKIGEFIKFVIGSTLMFVGVIVGGIAGVVANISYRMVMIGICWASDLRSRYMDMENPKFIDIRVNNIVQEGSSK